MDRAAFTDTRPQAPQSLAARAFEARDLAARFEALLLQSAFAPLAKALGFYGDSVVAIASQNLLRTTGSSFSEELERAIAADGSADAAR